MKKNLKSKISCQTPFKLCILFRNACVKLCVSIAQNSVSHLCVRCLYITTSLHTYSTVCSIQVILCLYQQRCQHLSVFFLVHFCKKNVSLLIYCVSTLCLYCVSVLLLCRITGSKGAFTSCIFSFLILCFIEFLYFHTVPSFLQCLCYFVTRYAPKNVGICFYSVHIALSQLSGTLCGRFCCKSSASTVLFCLERYSALPPLCL